MSSEKTTDYPIRDVDGTIAAIHRRIDGDRGGKRFFWLTANGTPSEKGKVKPASLPLYRAESISSIPHGAVVFISEGEKSADALARAGFYALGTVTGAASTPSTATLSRLAGMDVVLWPDNDDVGRAHMERIADLLAGIASRVRIASWGQEDGDDAADFFARDGTVDECRALIDAARVVERKTEPKAQEEPVEDTESLPTKPIDGNGQRIQTLAERIKSACVTNTPSVLALFAAHGVSDLKPNGPDGWYRGRAEWHGEGKDPGFGVNPATGSWCDHRDGDATGNLIEFLRGRAHLSDVDAGREVCRALGIEWREESPKKEQARNETKELVELGRRAVAGALVGKDPLAVVAILGADEETKRAVAYLRAFDTPAFVAWFGALRPRGLASYVLKVLNTVDVPKPQESERSDHSEMLSRSLDKIARGKRASIKLSDGDFEKHVEESILALRAENHDRLSVNKFGDALFCRGDVIVRISDAGDVPVPHIVTSERLRNRLANCAAYYTERMSEDGPQAVREYPPRDIAVAILHSHGVGFPQLDGIVSHPVVVIGDDGFPRCITKAGYDAQAKLLLHGFGGDALPEKATKADAEESLRWIRSEVLCDFPFAGPAEVAHAYALVFLPFVRRIIRGCTPLHLIEGSSQGAGKGFLGNACASFSIVKAARTAIPPTRDDEELRKKITMAFGTAAEMIAFDNLTGKMDSPTLAALLTFDDWTDRVLGTTDPVRYRNYVVWVATANNLTLDEDTARRSIRIRLEPKCENPSMRVGFRHEDIGAWTEDNRATCLRHAWTCVLAWVQAGCPMTETPPMGSFHSWSRVVGSLLAFLGVDGFLQNRGDLQTVSVSDSVMLGAFVNVWWERHQGIEVTSEQLLAIAEEVEYPIRGESEREKRLSVCWSVRKMRGRWIDGMQVTYLPQDHKARRTKAHFKLVRREAF